MTLPQQICCYLRASDAAHPRFKEFEITPENKTPVPTVEAIGLILDERPDDYWVPGIPFIGRFNPHVGEPVIFASDGEKYLELPCTLAGEVYVRLGRCQPLDQPVEIDEETREFLTLYRRSIAIIDQVEVASPPTVQDLLPDGLELTPDDTREDMVERMCLPEPLIRFLGSQYTKPEGWVIAEFYQGSEYLLYLEEIADQLTGQAEGATIRAAAIADGWPPRFLDRLVELALQGTVYLRCHYEE